MADEIHKLRARYSSYKLSLVRSGVGTVATGLFAFTFGVDSLWKGNWQPFALFGGLAAFAAAMSWLSIRAMLRIRRQLAALTAAEHTGAG